MTPPLRYRYNLPWRAVFVGALFYVGLSVFMFRLARGAQGVAFVVLASLSATFAALAAVMLTRRLIFPRMLELADDVILYPRGFPLTRTTRIAYKDIIRLREDSPDFIPSSSVVKAGESIVIGAAHFPDIASYRAAKEFICSRSSIPMSEPDTLEPSVWKTAGYPKPILHWVEPEDWPLYRTSLVVSTPLSSRLLKAFWFFGRCIAVFLLPWLLLKLFQLETLSMAGFLSLVVPATLFFTLLHWLNAAYPVHSTEISFRDNGITRFGGKQAWDWSYKDCSGCALIERQFKNRVLHILLLQMCDQLIAIAVPNSSAALDQLKRLLDEKNIPRMPNLKPDWEE